MRLDMLKHMLLCFVAGTACAPQSSFLSHILQVVLMSTMPCAHVELLWGLLLLQVGRERLHEVAMGQGQAEVALQLLRECATTGMPRGLATACKQAAMPDAKEGAVGTSHMSARTKPQVHVD